MDENLLHHAFEAATKAYSAGHVGAKKRLKELFPQLGYDTITEAYLQACRLHEFAYGVADKYRDQIHSKSEAMALLREHCPGFAERTYAAALAQGLYESR